MNFRELSDLLAKHYGLAGVSGASEARYFGDPDARIRLAEHDIVYDDGRIAVNIVIGGQESDVDPDLPVDQIIEQIDRRLAEFQPDSPTRAERMDQVRINQMFGDLRALNTRISARKGELTQRERNAWRELKAMLHGGRAYEQDLERWIRWAEKVLVRLDG